MVQAARLATELGQWSERELWIDLPEVFLDFVIEVMDTSVLDIPGYTPPEQLIN